jgi:hypothetical protein
LLKIFQSLELSAHVLDTPASPKEIVEPDTESQFAGVSIEMLESLLLKVFQSVQLISQVIPLHAVVIEKLTFGPTLAQVPFVIDKAGVDEEMFPKLREFCLLLKVFQSVGLRAPVVEVFAIFIPNRPDSEL